MVRLFFRFIQVLVLLTVGVLGLLYRKIKMKGTKVPRIR